MKSLTRLAFVGPMLGCHSGYVMVIGEILARLFARYGYQVVLTSTCRIKLLRLLDIAVTLAANSGKIDIQLLQVYGGLSFVGEDVASWLGRQFGQKIIMHIHGGAMREFMSSHSIWSRRVLSRADAIVCPSLFLARAMEECGFKAHIIPNLIEVETYPYRCRRHLSPRLFWMRTFHSVYNPEMAVRTLARVRKQFPEATLVMAGQDKGEQRAVLELAKQMSLQDALTLPGYLNMEEKIREGCIADIFLNTNRIDNTPVSVIEAGAFGLPVVATNVGGIADLVSDGETALLVPDNDDEAMAAAVLRLLITPTLAEKLSANGRALAERYSWENVRPQWESLFASVLHSL